MAGRRREETEETESAVPKIEILKDDVEEGTEEGLKEENETEEAMGGGESEINEEGILDPKEELVFMEELLFHKEQKSTVELYFIIVFLFLYWLFKKK